MGGKGVECELRRLGIVDRKFNCMIFQRIFFN